MEVSGHHHDPVALPPRERAPSTQWVAPTARVEALGKRKDLLSFLEHYHETSVVEPTAWSCY